MLTKSILSFSPLMIWSELLAQSLKLSVYTRNVALSMGESGGAEMKG